MKRLVLAFAPIRKLDNQIRLAYVSWSGQYALIRMATRKPAEHCTFHTISQGDLPSGRKGKHHAMLLKVLQDLERLPEGRAIRIPLADYPGTVADIRSAIHRATTKQKLEIGTSSDDEFFYVWKPHHPQR